MLYLRYGPINICSSVVCWKKLTLCQKPDKDFAKYAGVTVDKSQRKKDTIHQLTTMLSTSIDVLFPGHNHLLTCSLALRQ